MHVYEKLTPNVSSVICLVTALLPLMLSILDGDGGVTVTTPKAMTVVFVDGKTSIMVKAVVPTGNTTFISILVLPPI
jgi:hypothetical protein